MEEVSDLFGGFERHVGTNRSVLLEPSGNSVHIEYSFTESTSTSFSEVTDEYVVGIGQIPIDRLACEPHDLQFILGTDEREYVLRHLTRLFCFGRLGFSFLLLFPGIFFIQYLAEIFSTFLFTETLCFDFLDMDRMPRTGRSKSNHPFIPYINRNIGVGGIVEHASDIGLLGFDSQTYIEQVEAVFCEVFDLIAIKGILFHETCFVQSIATVKKEDTPISSCTIQPITNRDIVDRDVVRFMIVLGVEQVNFTELDLLVLARFLRSCWYRCRLWIKWHECRCWRRCCGLFNEGIVLLL